MVIHGLTRLISDRSWSLKLGSQAFTQYSTVSTHLPRHRLSGLGGKCDGRLYSGAINERHSVRAKENASSQVQLCKPIMYVQSCAATDNDKLQNKTVSDTLINITPPCCHLICSKCNVTQCNFTVVSGCRCQSLTLRSDLTWEPVLKFATRFHKRVPVTVLWLLNLGVTAPWVANVAILPHRTYVLIPFDLQQPNTAYNKQCERTPQYARPLKVDLWPWKWCPSHTWCVLYVPILVFLFSA